MTNNDKPKNPFTGIPLHEEAHPLAGQTVKVKFGGQGHPQIPGSDVEGQDFVVEDWWDHLTGGSWMFADGNPAALVYAMRSAIGAHVPMDDQVIYGKIGNFGHLVHTSEIVSHD